MWLRFANATWLPRHGLTEKPGPLVRPMTTNCVRGDGIASPGLRRLGMPMPLGQFGQEMSLPAIGVLNVVACAVGAATVATPANADAAVTTVVAATVSGVRKETVTVVSPL